MGRGSIYLGYGDRYTMGSGGRYTMGSRGRYTMGRGVDIPWVEEPKTDVNMLVFFIFISLSCNLDMRNKDIHRH